MSEKLYYLAVEVIEECRSTGKASACMGNPAFPYDAVILGGVNGEVQFSLDSKKVFYHGARSEQSDFILDALRRRGIELRDCTGEQFESPAPAQEALQAEGERTLGISISALGEAVGQRVAERRQERDELHQERDELAAALDAAEKLLTHERVQTMRELDAMGLAPDQSVLNRLRAARIALEQARKPTPPAGRKKLPAERVSITIKCRVGAQKFYLTVGFYPDGKPGELFLRMAKPEPDAAAIKAVAAIDASIQYAPTQCRAAMLGAKACLMADDDSRWSQAQGAFDAWAKEISKSLQSGVALADAVEQHRATNFAPSGAGQAGNLSVRYAMSILDLIARWLLWKFDRPRYEGFYGSVEPAESAAAAAAAAPTGEPGAPAVDPT